MKIQFVEGTHKIDGWCVRRMLEKGEIESIAGTLCSAGACDYEVQKDKITVTDYKEDTMVIVKQDSLFRLLWIIIHELCHVVVDYIGGHQWRKTCKWHKRIDKYL